MDLAIVLPLAINELLVGSCFAAGGHNERVAFVTALHHLASGSRYQVVVPPHGGDLSVAQAYPILVAPAIDVQLALAEPILDLAVLVSGRGALTQVPIPRFIDDVRKVKVGDEMIVVGYPFAPLGSFLETAHITHVSALGKRSMGTWDGRMEIILSTQTHPGSSGSPVIRRADGVVCGVIRGCLAPPGVISAGNIPLGTDTSVTYATAAHVIPQLIREALEGPEA